MITYLRLTECLAYDASTGVFTWKLSRGTRRAGSIAGSPHKEGYIQIKIDRVLYKAHRLAWLYQYKQFPDARLDHRDGVAGNNRIDNLRIATHSQNMANRKCNKNNTSGLKGTSYHKKLGRYIAYVDANCKRFYLGLFDTAEEAHEAYVQAARLHHGEFARAM